MHPPRPLKPHPVHVWKPHHPHPWKPHPARPPHVYPPVKPIRPANVYPPSKPRPPTSGYGVPKAPPIQSDGYQTSGSHSHASRAHDPEVLPVHPLPINRKEKELIPIGLIEIQHSSGLPPVEIPHSTDGDSALILADPPASFQRGSAGSNIISLEAGGTAQQHPHSGPASSQQVLTQFNPSESAKGRIIPAGIGIPELPLLPQPNSITPPGIPAVEAKILPEFKNDCGGPWVILERPIPDYPPSGVEIQPIPADYRSQLSFNPAKATPSGRRVPPLLPLEVNLTNSVENAYPDVLIFASGKAKSTPDHKSNTSLSDLFDQLDPFRQHLEDGDLKPPPRRKIPAGKTVNLKGSGGNNAFIPLPDNSKVPIESNSSSHLRN